MDLSQLSDDDLEALSAGDMSRVSDVALAHLSGEQPAAPVKPQTRVEMLRGSLNREYSLSDNIGGAIAEPVTTMVTGGIGAMAGGIAGIAQGAKNLVSPGMSAADRVNQVSVALTYQPRTPAGQATTKEAGAVLGYPFRKLAEGADKAGQVVSDATGSPAIGAGVNTAIQAVPALLLRGKVRNGRSSPNTPRAPVESGNVAPKVPAATQAGRKSGLARTGEKPPSIDELKSAKDAAYKRAEETGVVVSRNALNRLKVDLVNDLRKEGLDKDLHPKANAALKRITETKGQLTLSEIETLRKIANDAKGSIEKSDARLGARIVDKIDDFEANITDADVVSGNPAAATAFKEARALNTRLSKANTLQKLFDDAELAVGANYTAAGMDTALRQQFRSLAKSDRKMRGFTPEEKAAIRKVVMGGPAQNAMRLLGKFAPNGVVSSLAGMGSVMVAGPAGMVLPAAGIVARQGAAKMGLRNANAASEMVRAGPGNALVKKRKNALAEVE